MEKIVKIRQPLESTLNDVCLRIPDWKEQGFTALFLEMSDIRFMDSLAIGILVRLALTAREAKLRLNLYKMNPDVRRALLMSGAGDLLGIRSEGPPSFETEIM